MRKFIKKIFRINAEKEFKKEFNVFKTLSVLRPELPVEWNDRYPNLNDKTSTTNFNTSYIYHTGWAARKLREINPKFHIDISSSLYFISIASAIVPIKFYDYRPAKLNFPEIESNFADLLNLPFDTNTVKSLSCMHVIEHIGLGRYGDPLDINGDIKAIGELKRVIAINGSLLFVVPLGKPKIQFNAHRIYSYDQITVLFENDFELKEFSLIPDAKFAIENGIIYNADKSIVKHNNYACGCFWFIKKASGK